MNLKAMIEKRNATLEKMEELVNKASEETRALTEEENQEYEELKEEVRDLDKTIKNMEDMEKRKEKEEVEKEERSAEEIYADFIRTGETREMSAAKDGNIIPSELSNDIIKQMQELSGIFNDVSVVNSTGKYEQIIEKGKPSAGWIDELQEVTETSGEYDIIEIDHYKLGVLTKLSYEIVNQAHFDVTSEVNTQQAEDLAVKVEEAIIKGDGTKKPTGLINSGEEVKIPVKITGDHLIDIYHSLKAPYIANAKWYMNRKTLAEVRKLKDEAGQYLFMPDPTNQFVGLILGKPVEISEVMDDLEAGANPILFGDMKKAYKINSNPNMMTKILQEKYATQGAVGVLTFLFLDGKPVQPEAYTKVTVNGATK